MRCVDKGLLLFEFKKFGVLSRQAQHVFAYLCYFTFFIVAVYGRNAFGVHYIAGAVVQFAVNIGTSKVAERVFVINAIE